MQTLKSAVRYAQYPLLRRIQQPAALLLLIILKIALFCTGCERNATFKNTVTFTGSVYRGHSDENTNLLMIDGPAQDALISCDNFSATSKSKNDGSYSLTLSSVRTFSSLNADTFVVRSSLQGLNEKTTIAGKPGETIVVSDMILHQHTEE